MDKGRFLPCYFFSGDEIALIDRITREHRAEKDAAGEPDIYYDKSNGSIDTHFVGDLGEWAVGKFLGIAPHWLTQNANDGGVDFRCKGLRIQVKTTRLNDVGFFFYNISDIQKWDIGFLVHYLPAIKCAFIVGALSAYTARKECVLREMPYRDSYQIAREKLSDPFQVRAWLENYSSSPALSP